MLSVSIDIGYTKDISRYFNPCTHEPGLLRVQIQSLYYPLTHYIKWLTFFNLIGKKCLRSWLSPRYHTKGPTIQAHFPWSLRQGQILITWTYLFWPNPSRTRSHGSTRCSTRLEPFSSEASQWTPHPTSTTSSKPSTSRSYLTSAARLLVTKWWAGFSRPTRLRRIRGLSFIMKWLRSVPTISLLKES